MTVYGQSQNKPSKPSAQPLIITQITYTDFNNGLAGLGGSLTLGARFNKAVSIGLNVQVLKFHGDRSNFIPVCGEISFNGNKLRARPFFSLKAGKAYYNNQIDEIVNNARFIFVTRGGFFVAPMIGILIPVHHASGILLSGSYVNSSFSNTTTGAYNPANARYVNKSYGLEGYQLGVGFLF